MPAVSKSITGYPSRFIYVSITSLVVPSSSDTIATSLFEIKFNKDETKMTDKDSFVYTIMSSLRQKIDSSKR